MSERSPRRKVEFIESYWTGGEYGADYRWNDNHGELIRCKDCKMFNGAKKVTWCDKLSRFVTEDQYCSWSERKEPEEE